MQCGVLVTVDQHLVTGTWKLLTMLGQIPNPTQNLVTLTKHLQGTSTTPKTQPPSSAEASTSLHLKLKFCTLSRTLSALHRKVKIIENLVMYNLTHTSIFPATGCDSTLHMTRKHY